MKKIYLSELRTGIVKPLHKDGAMSAIHKIISHERLKIGRLGLENDEQADKVHHGGEEKAIHHYGGDIWGDIIVVDSSHLSFTRSLCPRRRGSGNPLLPSFPRKRESSDSEQI